MPEMVGEGLQAVLVEYAGGTAARLSLHEKRQGSWQEIHACPACVGRDGVGKEKEGDYKTPLGIFRLSLPFGILPDPGAKMGYIQVDENMCWCGCDASGHYNRLMDMRACSHACAKPEERLSDYPGAYNYAMFIDYNGDGIPGKGCCIFLHCFGEHPHTAGCVAVSEEDMVKILRWAGPGTGIMIKNNAE